MAGLSQENAVIITESVPEGRRFFDAFFARLGVRVFGYSFEEHASRDQNEAEGFFRHLRENIGKKDEPRASD